MQVKPIRTDADHEAGLKEIERLWGTAEGTPDGDRLEVLVTLVDACERERYPIGTPDPIQAIQFRLEQEGKDARALAGVIGSRSVVYEAMRRQRALSLNMIRAPGRLEEVGRRKRLPHFPLLQLSHPDISKAHGLTGIGMRLQFDGSGIELLVKRLADE
jgi:HTH-type transcriptional regulator/antitoxin HigA